MKKPRLSVTTADLVWLSLVLVLVVLQFWWLPGHGSHTADSWSTRLEGSRGLFNTLSTLSDQRLLPPVRRETDRLVPDKTSVLMILSPDRYPDDYEEEELLSYVHSGGVLVMAANWQLPNTLNEHYRAARLGFTISHDRSSRRSSSAAQGSTGSPAMAEESDDGVDQSDSTSLTGEAPADDSPVSPAGKTPTEGDALSEDLPEFVVAADMNELVNNSVTWRSEAWLSSLPKQSDVLVRGANGRPQVAAWNAGHGAIIVCATPDPFSNRSMLFEDQAELAVRLVEHATSGPRASVRPAGIIISEYLNGAGAYRGAAIVISPLLRAGSLQLVLVAVLMAWSGFHRFGPPLRTRSVFRRSLAENAEAVGNLQFTAGDGFTSVRQYLAWFQDEFQRRWGHSRILHDTAQLARQTGLPEDQIRQALDQANQQAHGAQVGTAEAAATIRQLARIHQKAFGKAAAEQ